MTALTAGDVVRRLLDAGLIRADDVVDSDLVVRNVSQSNGVYVLSAGATELVVKGPPFDGWEDQGRLRRERRFYARVTGSAALQEAAPVPQLVDSPDTLLVLRATRPGETLAERYRKEGPSPEDARMLGAALGAWRCISGQFADLELPGRRPWVLDALEPAPPDDVALSPGASRLADAIRAEPILSEGLRRLRAAWRQASVMHGDVRWDNAIVDRQPSGQERVVLVDWELLDLGEAGWDVAGALADAVVHEAVSSAGADAVGQFDPMPASDLARLSSAVAGLFDAFADAYRSSAPPAVGELDLSDGLRLLPARVLQIGFLHAAWSDSAELGSALHLAGVAAALFQQSSNQGGAA
jgi:hypothetical protein